MVEALEGRLRKMEDASALEEPNVQQNGSNCTSSIIISPREEEEDPLWKLSYLELEQRLIDHCKEREDLTSKFTGEAGARGERRL